MGQLIDVLEKFQNRKTYQELDRRALEISRKAASGEMGEGEYSDWAMISNDPQVYPNIVKTFITVLSARLSSNPFRPEEDNLNELGIKLKLNSLFSKLYEAVLNDGYAYAVVGMENGQPCVKEVDARYIMFAGVEPTLKDASDIVIFTIEPKPHDEDEQAIEFPDGFVVYDKQTEKVITHHYKKDPDKGGITLDIYRDDCEPDKKDHFEIPIDRIPVVRFVGNETELEDKRVHYRGLYHATAPLIKAMTVAATKIQINTAMFDDDNYTGPIDAIANHMGQWRSAGIKVYDTKDANGKPIDGSIAPIPKNYDFLVNTFNTWKNVIADMLGPVVQSSSEAATREEVIARNEVRDAITNNYLSKMADSIGEVYNIINQYLEGTNKEIVIQGGYLEEVKREKQIAQLDNIYAIAKESGLNTQGFAYEKLMLADLDPDIKNRIQQTFAADPNASPLTKQLKQQIEDAKRVLEKKDQQIAILRTQASQRLERQDSYVNMTREVKSMEVMFKMWNREQEDKSRGQLEFMKEAMKQGRMEEALRALDGQERKDTNSTLEQYINQILANTQLNVNRVAEEIAQTSLEDNNLPPIDPNQDSQQTAVGRNPIPQGWG